MEKFVQHIAAALLARSRTLATAESCTGGLVGAALTDLAGSSAWYLGGIVAYSNSLKTRLLGVPPELLAAHGAVSAETARAMAEGAQAKTGADLAISITGIAGPGGGTQDKPVGLVYMAVADLGNIAVFEHRFSGSRAGIRAKAVDAALRHVLAAATAPR
jgi:PncC family amidohydrolase